MVSPPVLGDCYRIPLYIDNTGGQLLTHYQLNVSLDGIDAESLSVTKSGTVVPHWCENVTGGKCYELWFNASDVPIGWTNDTYHICYGTGATSTADYDTTFTKTYDNAGLMLELHLDGGSGTTHAADSSPNGNDASLVMDTGGSPTSGWQGADGGQWGSRDDMVFSTGDHLGFDGIDDYANCGNDNSLDITGDITLSTWLYLKSATSTSSHIICRTTPGTPYNGYAVGFSAADQKLVVLINGGSGVQKADQAIPLTTWTHVAVSRSVGGEYKIFYDGAEVCGYLTTTSTSPNSATNNFYAGSAVDVPGWQNYCDVDMDELRVYDRALSEDEICRQYIRSKYSPTPPSTCFGAEEIVPRERISYTWNSVSDTDDNVPADYGAMVTFVADTVNATTTWTFAVNGSLYQTGANNSCNVTFAEFGMHSVSVNGTGAYGVTPDHNWSVVCQREIASGSVETFPDNSEDMQDSISGEPSFEEFCKILVTPYTSVFGSIFYLFVFGTPLLMLYIRQDSLATPTTIMFLFGSMVLFMLPAQWQAIGGALMVLGLLGALFRLFKERER